MAKYVFVTGGVTSSLGKGITAASIGRILKSRGLAISILKLDPYINVDPGTMSPYQHGKVFGTDDGAETDLDLGHYERFIDENLTRLSNVTTGQIYSAVIGRERRGDFLGGTIQVVPHVTNEIKERIERVARQTNAEVIIAEVGGTVGDIECQPFQLISKVGASWSIGRERSRTRWSSAWSASTSSCKMHTSRCVKRSITLRGRTTVSPSSSSSTLSSSKTKTTTGNGGSRACTGSSCRAGSAI